MLEEKSNLLSYFLDAPLDRIFTREMDTNKVIHDYSFGKTIQSIANLGLYLNKQDVLGDNIPLLLETSFDFIASFFGILAAKKICVPIHTIAHLETIEFILKKVKAQCIIVTEVHLYQKLVQLQYVHEHIHTIFTVPEVMAVKALPCSHINIHEIFNQNQSTDIALNYLQSVVSSSKVDDIAQIVFTSGTTGEPKGASLSHRNMISCAVRAGNHLHIDSSYKTLTFLPFTHVMAQTELLLSIFARATLNIVGRDNLLHGLKTFKPNIIVSVPRVYQAIYQGIQKKLRRKKLARKIVSLATQWTAKSHESKNFLSRCYNFVLSRTLGRLLTAKIRHNLGQFKLLVTAGAACPTNIYDFYQTIGLPLTNAQGLTEVAGAIFYNNANETYKGSVGYALPGVEVKIDDDGEILVKGDPVFSGYYEEEEYNHSAFTPDGWFKTGDLGSIQRHNKKDYVFLKGRKKEILVLSSGLNIPAVQIEDRLMQHDLIHQVMVVGDGKPKLAALIVPVENMTQNINIRLEISKIIKEVNECMDASEQIGEFEILEEPFTIENGMLTPTLKIRRPVILQKYQDIIGHFYSASAC
jgi:long-chain acyl-CoA synthetase